VFEDNIKAWSGDHDVDPSAVPGVLFSNLKLKAQNPRLIDLAPTVLDLFAVPIPSYMEGKPIM
jgi:bisphosphoglycerate-independent phosphoglycerate mutase (AlkP superfamily)